MPEVTDLHAKPPRTWQPMVLWTAGILLALGLAWFVGAVVVPVWRTKAEVRSFRANVLAWNPVGGPEGDQLYKAWRLRWAKVAVSNLGGPGQAEGKLRFYVKLPSGLAPEQDSAMELLGYCQDSNAGTLSKLANQAAANEVGDTGEANPWELREVTRTEVLRLYRRCESGEGLTGCPPAWMGMFEIAMKKAGPEVVPILVGLLGTPPVSRQEVFRCIYAIDAEHGTSHYVELLVSKEVAEKYRIEAAAHISDYGRGTAEKLDKRAADPGRPDDERARAKAMADRVAKYVLEDPRTPEQDRAWARKRLTGEKGEAK